MQYWKTKNKERGFDHTIYLIHCEASYQAGFQSLKYLFKAGLCSFDRAFNSSLNRLYILSSGVKKTTKRLLESQQNIRRRVGAIFWKLLPNSSNVIMDVSQLLTQFTTLCRPRWFLFLNPLAHQFCINLIFSKYLYLRRDGVDNCTGRLNFAPKYSKSRCLEGGILRSVQKFLL